MRTGRVIVRRRFGLSTPEAPLDVDVPSAGADRSDLASLKTSEPVRTSPTEQVEQPQSRVVPAYREDVRHTRISAAWAAVAVAVVLGVALVDFIVGNTHSVHINFFSVSGYIPVDVVMLVSLLVGAFVVLGVGVSRTTQLRLALRRRTRSEKAHAHVHASEIDPGSSTD